MTYSVLVVDMFKAPLKESKHTVGGFATLELACEYARRRTWGSVEEQRRRHVAGADEVKRRWFQFGEDCSVVDDPQYYEGLQDLAHFIEHPPKTTKQTGTKSTHCWTNIRNREGMICDTARETKSIYPVVGVDVRPCRAERARL
ncbi:MAG TPA: hypothetical protein VGR65_04425 [Casimicrobiaceae bacterium]|jgi:hypothetical protein|nr:hypothetical protein [Casimicrobiaceae bacterium]